ncbi:MAG: response regulator [Myxococcales bacterium]|nr:response regulator [Myxococcales bacterium]
MASEQPLERARLLVVDDEESIRDMLAEFLTLEGYLVRTAPDGLDALRLLAVTPAEVVLTDLKMPRMGGIELLDELRRTAPRTLAIIMTGFGTVETAIHAMKRGAYDYILKPFKLGEVLHVIQRALDKKRMEAENIRLREALSLYKVSEAISGSLSLDQVMDTVVTACLQELKADFVSAWLEDGEGGLFERERRLSDDPRAAELGALEPRTVLRRLQSDEPVLLRGEAVGPLFAEGSVALPSSFAAVPLRVNSRTIGFIAAASAQGELEEGQRKVLSIIAARAAAAIENARLFGDLQATFQQTIQGLASAIDKMDRYTAGHSGRVASYAVYLATRLGLPPEEIEVVRQSALMHDIGKIGCVLNLNKPGKLTADEYEVFKRHPGFGKDILDPIRFLHPLIPGVHLHHERFDGRGYPLRLEGRNIPLIARIISVADTYDAMTSDRSYRRALPHEVAVAEITRCSGTQFDPDMAGLFIEGLDAYRDEVASRGLKVPE